MLKYSELSLVASVMLIAIGLICYILVLTLGRSVQQPVVTQSGGSGPAAEATATPPPRSLALYGTYFTWIALIFLTVTLILRTIVTGHGPFSNQYEFAVAFAWGSILAYVYFEHRYHVRTLALLVLPIALALSLYAMSVGATPTTLPPALQQSFLLTVHVVVAIIAYGAFSVAFAAAVLHLIQPQGGRRGLPKPALLDEIGYRAVIVAFPLLTMTVILGAIWAEIAWGRYWSWDPKESASLLIWLIYGAYLHARVVHGWRGRRSAWLLVAGFAAVLFTFFGNLFFGGLHSYGGV